MENCTRSSFFELR